MTRAERGKHIVESVLRYLRDMADYAQQKHNRFAWAYYSDGAVTLHDAFYGPIPSPWWKPASFPVVVPREVKPTPRWRLELNARPLRRVIRRVYKLQRNEVTNTHFRVAQDHLSCGHVTAGRIEMPGDREARHRRCVQCGAIALAGGMVSADSARRVRA